MTVIETIIAEVRHLSAEDQQRVLELLRNFPSARTVGTETPANVGGEQSKRAIWKRLQALGEASEKMPCDLPEDLAANHDFYLHALPKRS